MTQTPLDLNAAEMLGDVTYNGYTFPPAIKATVSFNPEYSDDGRTIKYVRADLSIEFIVVPGVGGVSALIPYDKTDSIDDEMDSLRRRLERPCQRLQFTTRGAGTFDIQSTTKVDVNYGPKPKPIQWRPLGDNRSARIVWECSTWFAECATQIGLTGIAQLGYTISWGFNRSGILSRNISGRIEVPLSRTARPGQNTASPVQTRSADEVWEQVLSRFPRIDRFHRETSKTLSNDRKYLEWTINDTEIPSPNPYFKGIVEVRASRRYSTGYKDGFQVWQGGIRGDVEVAPGYSLYRGWLVFYMIFNDIFARHTKGKRGLSVTTNATEPGQQETQPESYGLITGFDFDEQLFERAFSFSASYMLFCTLGTLFDATGLFQPLNISPSEMSWNVWKTSMEKVQAPRGWMNANAAYHNLEGDIIVDLCEPTPNLSLTSPPTSPSNESVASRENERKTAGIAPEKSWIQYDAEYRIEASDGTAISIPLQKNTPVQESLDVTIPKSNTNTPRTVPQGQVSAETPVSPIINRVRPTAYKLIFTGYAVRAGYQISTPNVLSVGGIAVRKCGVDNSTPNKLIGKGTDVTTGKPYNIYATAWRKEYILESLPPNANIVTDGRKAMYG